ncbi:MAG: hypothetical protein AAB415_03130 [Patescibacteria group bacterium]
MLLLQANTMVQLKYRYRRALVYINQAFDSGGEKEQGVEIRLRETRATILMKIGEPEAVCEDYRAISILTKGGNGLNYTNHFGIRS